MQLDRSAYRERESRLSQIGILSPGETSLESEANKNGRSPNATADRTGERYVDRSTTRFHGELRPDDTQADHQPRLGCNIDRYGPLPVYRGRSSDSGNPAS
jgi:hypothetical protein